jgi:uncharacterized membrane protein YgcG
VTRTGTITTWLVVALACCVVLVSARDSASAQDIERIRNFDVTISITTDGDLEVLEVIDYDFGTAERHGIYRDIPVRYHYDDRYDRIYRLSVQDITTSSGTPDEFTLEDAENGRLRIRIGDPDQTITGRHTYSILYRVEGALNAFDDHDELYWNATGLDWAVPVDSATVTVKAPDEISSVRCFAGAQGSLLPCHRSILSADRAIFAHENLLPYEGISFVVALPTGVVVTPSPILKERWSAQRAFAITPLTVGLTVAIAALLLGVIGRMLWNAGRDRRYRGSAVDVVFGTESGEVQRVPLFEGAPIPVEYTPPGDLRPGLIGTIRDEVAHPLDVTATIIDLAARGFLRIDEIEGSGRFARSDWQLTRLTRNTAQLEAYERLLIDGLFEDAEEVELSALRTKFATRLRKVQDELYRAMVSRGWYRSSPAQTRQRWLLLGFGVLIAGIALFIFATVFTHWAIVPIPVMVGGILLIAAHQATPARTAPGTAMLRRVRGFERFIASAEVYRARFAEESHLFYDYLPYAIVFGLTDQWARAFEGLGDIANPPWYSGTNAFSVAAFSHSMNSFAVTSAGVVAATPASSGSSGFGGGGFSGGGGGGGGGGSW